MRQRGTLISRRGGGRRGEGGSDSTSVKWLLNAVHFFFFFTYLVIFGLHCTCSEFFNLCIISGLSILPFFLPQYIVLVNVVRLVLFYLYLYLFLFVLHELRISLVMYYLKRINFTFCLFFFSYLSIMCW